MSSMPSSNNSLVKELSRSESRVILGLELPGDIETPVSAYWKLAHNEVFSFLLESVNGGEQVGRYSLVGVRPKRVILSKNDKVIIETRTKRSSSELESGMDPLHLLERELGKPESDTVPGLPPFYGGAVGLMAYDLVRYFENLPNSCTDDLNIEDLAMMITHAVIVFDHAKSLIQIIAIAEPSTNDVEEAVKEIERIADRLLSPLPPLPSSPQESFEVSANVTQAEFETMVSKLVEYITAGDGVQFVPSQRFQTHVKAHPLTVYRALRSINPSPYMFLLRFENFDLVGASPELLVSIHGDRAHLRPIAGTRWRGINAEEDARLAEQLLLDEKERAEHVMLVDLGRNDLGRVCEYGSVEVGDLMVIEKYSHVMHIVSDVTGKLRTDKSCFDLLRACFPAGTVSGAPKIRAMEIIDEVEKTRRGVYAGSVGFFSYSGNMDSCIAIRTILIKDGIGYVQAGGGVVYDSVPTKEYEESRNKAKACLRAIEKANRGF